MPTATPPQAANKALATRENQGNLAPVYTGAVFLVLHAVISRPSLFPPKLTSRGNQPRVRLSAAEAPTPTPKTP